MLLLISVLLLIILLSRITEELSNIPSTLTIIVYAFLLSYFFPSLFSITSEEFNEILYLMLPIILLPDILNISIKELKSYAKEIFYLAVVAVVCSIAIAVFVTPYLLPEYSWSIGMLIALFSMLMATDAITVGSIMSRFRLPKRLKIYAESESLFNDVTALIIFYFIALPLLEGVGVDFFNINYILVKVLILSTVIGVVSAYLGFLAIKILKNPFDQFVIIYLMVIVSFLLAEYFHIAGILSIVASVIVFKLLVQKEGNAPKKEFTQNNELGLYEGLYELIKNTPALSKHEFREYKKEAMFVGIFANAVVFVIIAMIIDHHLLFEYLYEIILVFCITSFIRFFFTSALIMGLKLPFYWAQTLTLSGTKGALAIIMVHSLPQGFIYKELFTAVVVGNVLLSTFIYTFFLMLHIKQNTQKYEQDLSRERLDNEEGVFSKEIIEVLEKDALSKAYNRTFIEDILSQELARMQRYKTELSAIMIELDLSKLSEKEKRKSIEQMGALIVQDIRTSDSFGKIDNNRYIVIVTNTSLSGALALGQKLLKQFQATLATNLNSHFGVTQAHESDDVASLFEKLYDALEKSTQNHIKVEVEV